MLLQNFIDKMEPKATFSYLHSSAIQNYRLLKVAAKRGFFAISTTTSICCCQQMECQIVKSQQNDLSCY